MISKLRPFFVFGLLVGFFVFLSGPVDATIQQSPEAKMDVTANFEYSGVDLTVTIIESKRDRENHSYLCDVIVRLNNDFAVVYEATAYFGCISWTIVLHNPSRESFVLYESGKAIWDQGEGVSVNGRWTGTTPNPNP